MKIQKCILKTFCEQILKNGSNLQSLRESEKAN